nr:MAG TPA: hypothetical protein [Caudoviricetes sp.]
MDNDLNEIKARFNRIEKRRLIRWLIALTVALLLCAGVLMLRSGKKETFSLSCRISAAQKDVLTDLIKQTAACGKTSKIAIYKALKAHFKYETIGKMPCDQFDEAEKILNDMKRRFCP